MLRIHLPFTRILVRIDPGPKSSTRLLPRADLYADVKRGFRTRYPVAGVMTESQTNTPHNVNLSGSQKDRTQ
jgi:hypothetical protein